MSESLRPTVQEVFDKIIEIKGAMHHLPKTKNKGAVGHLAEVITGIPISSACLDCEDGELKTISLKKDKNGKFKGAESIAVTMLSVQKLEMSNFDDSKCYSKLKKTLYVPYYRDGDNVQYMQPILVELTIDENVDLKNQLEDDYKNIQSYLAENGTLEGSSRIGKYLQNRTKGAGKGAPKTRAFYLRASFINEKLLTDNWFNSS
jgi:DNA mismatch repair protein MutH